MDFSISTLAAGFVFGVFGVYFLKRGRARGSPGQIGIGIVLCVYPYVISSPVWIWVVGIALLIGAFRIP